MGRESPGAGPDAPEDGVAYPRPAGWQGRVTAANPEQARRWMRRAWLGGLAWWVWTIGVLMVWMAAPIVAVGEEAGAAPAIPSARLLIYYGVEGCVIALLSYGVMRRWRPAALLLAGGFLISRIALVALGLITVAGFRDLIWLAIYGVLLFAFVRGVQGAFSYHWFTHPKHPTAERYRDR